MPTARTTTAKAKSVSVRIVKNRTRRPEPVRHLVPSPADPLRERILWRSVAAASAIILLIGAVTIWANLSKPPTSDTFWSGLTTRIAQVGNDFTDFWKQLLSSKTVRPEDKYKELEQKVFPPLPASAQE